MAFPDVTTVLDDTTRADATPPGAPWSGGLASGTCALAIDGNELTVAVSGDANGSGVMSGSYGPNVDFGVEIADASALAAGDDFAIAINVQTPGSTAWEGYYLVWIGGTTNDTWSLRKHVAFAGTTLQDVSTGTGKLATGDRLALEHDGTTLRMWKYTVAAGTWGQIGTDETDSDLTVAGQVGAILDSNSVKLTNFFGGTIPAPPSGVSLYLDPDNAAADDAHDRGEASDPATPVATWARVLELVEDGDEVHIVPPADRGTLGELFTTEQETTATSVVVKSATGDPYPIKDLYLRFLFGWTFEDCDTDNGQGGLSSILGCENMTFRRWTAHSGGANILNPRGSFLWEECVCEAPLTTPAANFLDGVGWRFHYAFGGVSGIGDVTFRDCESFDVQGEDAIQFLGGDQHTGLLLVERHHFHDMVQSELPGSPHTDAIQIIGANEVTIRDSRFNDVDSMIITSDDQIFGTLLIENTLFVGNGAGNSTQFFGLNTFIARHNTWAGSGAVGLRLGYDARAGVATTPTIDLHNNVIDLLQVDDFDHIANPDTFSKHNVIGTGPASGDDVVGFAEYGVSDDTDYELSNTPSDSPGVDQGVFVAGDPTVDRLGRARHGAPDCGCHESDPAVLVAPGARAPYIVGRTPAQGAVDVAPGTNVAAVLFPKPGVAIDPATVTPETFFVTDPSGDHLPVIGAGVGAPDGGGRQTLTLDIDGDLRPLVVYTAHLLDGIADEEGSGLAADASWAFRGPDGSGVVPPDTEVAPPSVSVRRPDLFPNGTVLGLYRAVLPTSAAAPRTPLLDTETVAGDVATFAGLETGVSYEVAADVAGAWRRVFVHTKETHEGKTAAENRVAWRWPRGAVPTHPDEQV